MKKITLSLVLLGTLAFASEVNIDVQIEEIKNASAQQRVELMNEFKLQLSQMNQEDRAETISKLQDKMQAKKQETEGSHTQESSHESESAHSQEGTHQEGSHEQMKEHAQTLQMEQNEHMQQNQQMNQQQAGNQYVHEQENMGQESMTQGVNEGFMQNEGH